MLALFTGLLLGMVETFLGLRRTRTKISAIININTAKADNHTFRFRRLFFFWTMDFLFYSAARHQMVTTKHYHLRIRVSIGVDTFTTGILF